MCSRERFSLSRRGLFFRDGKQETEEVTGAGDVGVDHAPHDLDKLDIDVAKAKLEFLLVKIDRKRNFFHESPNVHQKQIPVGKESG